MASEDRARRSTKATAAGTLSRASSTTSSTTRPATLPAQLPRQRRRRLLRSSSPPPPLLTPTSPRALARRRRGGTLRSTRRASLSTVARQLACDVVRCQGSPGTTEVAGRWPSCLVILVCSALSTISAMIA
jgi:hypothetical protein